MPERERLDTDKLVMQAFKQAPDFSLPDNFADVLAEKVGRKFAWQQYIREFLIYLAVILGIGAITAAIAFFWYEADWKLWLDFLINNMGWIVGANILLVFILFADRVLLRYFMFKSSMEKLSN